MIDTLTNLLFRCSHRRLTRPITPAGKPGVNEAETYVVCLNCGKQFSYDWKLMRIGKPVERGKTPEAIRERKRKFAFLGAVVPFAVILGKALLTRRRPQTAGHAPPVHPGDH